MSPTLLLILLSCFTLCSSNEVKHEPEPQPTGHEVKPEPQPTTGNEVKPEPQPATGNEVKPEPQPNAESSDAKRKVWLISFDGMKHNYYKRLPTPNNFTLLANRGVWAPNGIKNTFATVTFPTHYAIATGLFEESHGIVANQMYVAEQKRILKFTVHDKTDPRFVDPKAPSSAQLFKGEPIWNTVSRIRGNDSTIGCMMYIGCNYVIGGRTIKRVKQFDKTTTLREKIDQVLKWFTEEDLELVMMYHNEPDATGHLYGPQSQQILDRLIELNNDVGYLISALDSSGVELNLILTGDHGMSEVKEKFVVKVDRTNIKHLIESGAIWHVEPVDGKIDEVIDMLKSLIPPTKAIIYRKEDLPSRYHYFNNERILSIVIVVRNHIALLTEEEYLATKKPIGGEHGYSNDESDMWPHFIAAGPQLKEGYKIKNPRHFTQQDIYSLISALLDVEPAPTNGSLNRAKLLMKGEESSGSDCVCATVVSILISLMVCY